MLNKIIWINEKTELRANPVKITFEDDDHPDGTNVDIKIDLDDGHSIFIEVKYTEARFGSTTINDKTKEIDTLKYRDKFKKFYANDVSISYENFNSDYQFVRNIILSKNGNYTVFLFSKENDSVQEHYERCLYHIMNCENFTIGKLYWEDIIKYGPKEFKDKYFEDFNK